MHGGDGPIGLTLPAEPWAVGYTVAAHTGLPGELPEEELRAGSELSVPGRTVVLLQAILPTPDAGTPTD